ncbi:ComEC/Rec2 family competence protein [uncultured Algimonas sp.]|uniref:ComEC/Rec2 family competence protein n=1 Tax=uncultured Algimonas sp. TaxID=1547920 RepID=UPI00261F623E|nr:ComEC/Rec2 family competence protein [uncultured Algimonas sp.]
MGGFQSQIAERGYIPAAGRGGSLPRLTLSFELAIIAFGIGIGTYFAWPTEPRVWIVLLAALIVWAAAWRAPSHSSAWPSVLLIALIGFGWCAIHAKLVSPNPLVTEQRLGITGWVSGVETGGRMRRLTIDVIETDRVPDSGQPERVRIRVGRTFPDFEIGDGIHVQAVVGPLPGPVVPDGYDPGRRAYFDGLAGTGFAISPGTRVEVGLSGREHARVRLERLRADIVERVIDSAPDATSGLQAALLTGIRDHIPDEQTEALRRSGLAHVLAISGLHMGMVAFGVFVCVSASLAAVERLSRGRDVRKIAAFVGIVSATLYLLLSGASVATQRAYIMVSIAFLAVMFDRRAISVRSVAVAALLTLLIRPEALVSVGFQMSFAAVTAMVVIFRAWQDRWPSQRPVSFRDKVGKFYGSLFGTSLVAGLATGGFALLHFGRIANYGLLANMAAMAVFPVVMASGVVALLLMPLGLEALPLQLMSWLLQFMLSVADWVSAMPGAVGTVKASQPWVIGLYGLGFAVACLATRSTAAIGIAAMTVSLIGWSQAPNYELRISDSGRVSILSGGESATSSLRADRYGRDQFARASGDPDIVWRNYRDALADCDALACRVTVGTTVVTVIEEPSEVIEACETSDIVVLASRNAGPVARRGCTARLLDVRELARTGGVHVDIGEAPPKVVPILTEARRNRPWGG